MGKKDLDPHMGNLYAALGNTEVWSVQCLLLWSFCANIGQQRDLIIKHAIKFIFTIKDKYNSQSDYKYINVLLGGKWLFPSIFIVP